MNERKSDGRTGTNRQAGRVASTAVQSEEDSGDRRKASSHVPSKQTSCPAPLSQGESSLETAQPVRARMVGWEPPKTPSD